MNLNEQIEAAFKDFRSKNGMRVSCQDFAEIYRAALRSLYQEVKPEELEEAGRYWIRKGEWIQVEFNHQWRLDWIVPNGDGFLLLEANPSECGKILKGSLPSPSKVFGEEGV